MIEWVDLSQTAMYREAENKWHQLIGFCVDGVKLEVEVAYDYGSNSFHYSDVYVWSHQLESALWEDEGKALVALKKQEDFALFLADRQTYFDTVFPYLQATDVEIADISWQDASAYGKEAVFTLHVTGEQKNPPTIQWKAFLTKNLDWSLEELTSTVNGHTVCNGYLGTILENRIEHQLLQVVS